MTTAAPQLDYAPGAPIRRRRRVRRVIWLLLLVGLFWAAWYCHTPLWEHAKLLYYQRQCLNYTAPPEQVVYDENNGTASPLLGTPGYRGMPAVYLGMPGSATVAVRPASESGNYQLAMGQPYPAPPSTVFLHERRTKSGVARLVMVMRWPVDTGHIVYEFGLQPVVIEPAGVISPPVVNYPLDGEWSRVPLPNPADTQKLRFYAGQPDPVDSAHFTIKYDLRGGSGIIDGRLNEDGTTVTLKIISGPALKTRWVIDANLIQVPVD